MNMAVASARRLLGLALGCVLAAAERAAQDAEDAHRFHIRRWEIGGEGRVVPAPDPLALAAAGLQVADRFHPATVDEATAPFPRISPPRPPSPPPPWAVITQWHQSDGLPADKVRSVLHARDGSLWVGTVGGLARFDGVRFRVWDESNTPALVAGGSVGRHLLEDTAGVLWIGTERGILCWREGAFATVPGQDQVRGHKIHQLAQRSRGGIWVASDRGLGWLDDGGFHPMPTAGADPMTAVTEDAGGRLWAASAGGLTAWGAATGERVRTLAPEDFNLPPAHTLRIASLMADREGRLWIGANHGAWVLEQPGGPLIALPSPEASVATWFAPDDGGWIWVLREITDPGMPARLMALDRHSRDVRTSLTLPVRPGCAPCRDTEGSLWTGGRTGLMRIRPRPLTSIRLPPMQTRVRMGAVDVDPEGVLWFSNGHQIGRWTGTDLRFLALDRLNGPITHQVYRPFVVRGPHGRLWFGNGDQDLLSLPESALDGGAPASVTRSFATLGPIRSAARGRRGDLWVGGDRGVFRVTGSDTAAPVREGSPATPQALLEDSRGTLWIGSSDSVVSEVSVEDLRVRREYRAGIGSGILTLAERRGGGAWVGTESGPAWVQGNVLRGPQPLPGATRSRIQGIAEDSRGGLWMLGDFGLLRVAVAELERWLGAKGPAPVVALLGRDEGLDTLTGPSGSQAMVQAGDGRLWFTRDETLVTLIPAAWALPQPLRVRLDAFRRGADWVEASRSGPLVLPEFRQDSPLEFRLGVSSFDAPRALRILHRLEGTDSQWQRVGDDRVIRLAGLPPGRRTITVRAHRESVPGGVDELQLPLNVVAGFHQSWPFRLGAAGGVLGLATGWTAWRLRRQRRRLAAERLRELEQERRRIARDLHDHLGAHLAGMALSPESGPAAGQGARESLDALRDVIWTLQPGSEELSALLNQLADIAHRALQGSGIELDLEYPESIPPLPVPGAWRHEISALIRESLRNTRTHAEATRVQLRVRLEEHRLVIEVNDNGRGIPGPAEEPGAPHGIGRRGHGMVNLRERCRDLGGVCRTDSAPGQGTTITFRLPLSDPTVPTPGSVAPGAGRPQVPS